MTYMQSQVAMCCCRTSQLLNPYRIKIQLPDPQHGNLNPLLPYDKGWSDSNFQQYNTGPYKKEQKENQTNGCEIFDKYQRKEEKGKIRNKIFREVGIQNLLRELEEKWLVIWKQWIQQGYWKLGLTQNEVVQPGI